MSAMLRGKKTTLAALKRSQETHPWETRDGLVAALKATRKHRVCGYRGDRCDCKYGIAGGSEVMPSSEQTGCPELYEVIALLEAMTKADFDRLIIKARSR